MIEKLSLFSEKIICFLFLLIMSYILLANIKVGMRLPGRCFIGIVIIITYAVFVKSRIRLEKDSLWYSLDFSRERILLISGIVLGIILKLLPIWCNFEWILQDNQDDCAVHFFGAQQLMYDGRLSDANAWYESIFLQLYPYTFLLSLFLKFFGNINLAVVFSNILFDSISVFYLSKLLRRLNRKPVMGILVWWLNPFFIVMCWLPMAIVVVNMLLMITIYLGYCLLQVGCNQSRRLLCTAFAFGFFIFIGNLFRPLFYVVLIAEIITILLKIMKNSEKWKLSIVAILITIICALLPGNLYRSSMTELGGYKIPAKQGAWNFFVGANYGTHGAWSPEDWNYFFTIAQKTEYNYSEVMDILMKEGLQRYSDMIPHIGNHILNKMNILFADVGNSIWNLRWTFQISEEFYSIWSEITTVYYIGLIAILFISCLYRFIHKNIPEETFLIVLTFIGFSMAYVLVEVMNRYISMLFVPLILILGLLFPYKMVSKSSSS